MFKIFVNLTMKSHNVLTNCKRKTSFRKRNILHHRFIKFFKYRSILMEGLHLESKFAGKVLYYQQFILDLPQEHVMEQCKLCRTMNIDSSTLVENADLMNWSTNLLKHKVLLLQELGVPRMDAAMVSKFHILRTMRVGMFKASTGIPADVNIADNLLKCLDEPPPSVAPLEAPSENLSVKHYRDECLKWYIKWRLQVPEDDVTAIEEIAASTNNRSFEETRKLLNILHDDVGFTIDQIRKYRCLSGGSADDLRKIIDNIQTFGGIGFGKLIKKRPALLAMKYENVIAMIKLIEENGFSRPAMRCCPEILVVDKNDMISRLETIDSTPELRVLKNNVRMLILICKFHVVNVRLEYLSYLNIKFVTVRLLTSSRRSFKRFIRTGEDLTRSKEIGNSFKKVLQLSSTEIRKRIEKHPYWRHIEPVAMHDTLELLLERFTPKDLHNSLQLLLYPRQKVKEVLESLPELSEEPKRLKPKEIVATCLYELEKEHHFSGDGVWKYDERPLPRRPIATPEPADSEFSDSETAEPEETPEAVKIVE